MSLNFNQLYTACQRRTKTESDTTALAGFKLDLNIANQIVSTRRNWPELITSNTLSLTPSTTVPEGAVYTVQSDVDVIEQMRITSPTASERVLEYILKTQKRKIDPVSTNSGTGSPLSWFYEEPTINAGVEQKNVNFWPLPDQAYTITYSYKKFTPQLVLDTDIPFFNPNFHQILIDYAIWKFCERDPDTTLNPNYFMTLWQQGMADMDAFFVTQTKFDATIPGPDQYLTD